MTILSAAAMLLAAQVAASAPAPAAPAMPAGVVQPIAQVGIFEDPCAHIPARPEAVVAYMTAAAKARATGQTPPPPTFELLKLAADWQATVNAADFAGLCRYDADNATLAPATQSRVVFFGDSITELWGVTHPAFFQKGDRVDRGISGQTTAQMIGRFRKDVIDLHPAVVHILAGVNDIAGNTGPTSLANIENNIRSMAELARLHGVHVVLASPLPAKQFNWRPDLKPVPSILALNAWIKDYARANGLTYVDYYRALNDGEDGLSKANSLDGVHPTAAGYAIMEPLADKALAAALAKK